MPSSSSKDADPTLGYLTRKDTEVKLPCPTRLKNKTPAPIQITVEQILREARERQEAEIRPPKQKITDPTELETQAILTQKLGVCAMCGKQVLDTKFYKQSNV